MLNNMCGQLSIVNREWKMFSYQCGSISFCVHTLVPRHPPYSSLVMDAHKIGQCRKSKTSKFLHTHRKTGTVTVVPYYCVARWNPSFKFNFSSSSIDVYIMFILLGLHCSTVTVRYTHMCSILYVHV